MPERGTALVVLIGGQRSGTLAQDRDGTLRLTYEEDWCASPHSTPLSLSMPLTRRTHDDPVRAFLWGLLPDSEPVLERWAKAYQVSPRNPFALLRHVGEDCAGAAQFADPGRVQALLADDGGVKWMNVEDIAARVRLLRADPAAWHVGTTTGQFSLAGAQAKTALFLDPAIGRWAEPWGAVPTTHIIKPAVTGFDDHDLNEHLCMEAARRLGLSVAASRVASFAGERVIVIDRYDRLRHADGRVTRAHQEDMCQALGIPPTIKYQNEGGPSPEQIIDLLRQEVQPAEAASDAVRRFVDALALNWIIAGTDAHAKNYSVLLSGRSVRLAPLYDVASALPYDDMYLPRLRMAMRIGGEYRVAGVKGRHWRRFATRNGLDPDVTVARVDHLAAQTPTAFEAAMDANGVRALNSDLPARLLDRITMDAARCRAALAEQ